MSAKNGYLDLTDAVRRTIAEQHDEIAALRAENTRLNELIEHLQPTDTEGNVLDIADTVHMLRSEYDGDHEWDDVVVGLELTKWGGDRWIARGSKGEAWACDCTKTGHDEDSFERSDDVEPFEDVTLVEVAEKWMGKAARFETENDKLRELVKSAMGQVSKLCDANIDRCAGCPLHFESDWCRHVMLENELRESGIEV